MNSLQTHSRVEQIEALTLDFEKFWAKTWPLFAVCDPKINEKSAKFVAWIAYLEAHDMVRRKNR